MHMRTCAAQRHKHASNYWGLRAGTNKGRGWFISPRVVSDSHSWKSEEGRRIVSRRPFFLSWQKEGKREGALSDHTSYDYTPVFPPSLSFTLCFSISLHTHTHTHILPCVDSRRSSWKVFSFPRKGQDFLFSQNWGTDSVLDLLFRCQRVSSQQKWLQTVRQPSYTFATDQNCAKHWQ